MFHERNQRAGIGRDGEGGIEGEGGRGIEREEQGGIEREDERGLGREDEREIEREDERGIQREDERGVGGADIGQPEVGRDGERFRARGIPVFKKGLSFVSINARSLLPKMSEMRYILEQSTASILAVSETWLDANITDEEIGVRGYSVMRRDRDRHGGGVALYIKDTLAFNLRRDLETEGMESIWAEILLPKSRGILVSSIYRPPSDGNFLAGLEASLEKMDVGKEVYVLGDINIDYIWYPTDNVNVHYTIIHQY